MPVGSAQVSVGTGATLLASVPASTVPGQVGAVLLFADATKEVYLGGANVSTTNGLTLTHGLTAPFVVPLFPGDVLYGCVSSGSGTVGVLQV